MAAPLASPPVRAVGRHGWIRNDEERNVNPAAAASSPSSSSSSSSSSLMLREWSYSQPPPSATVVAVADADNRTTTTGHPARGGGGGSRREPTTSQSHSSPQSPQQQQQHQPPMAVATLVANLASSWGGPLRSWATQHSVSYDGVAERVAVPAEEVDKQEALPQQQPHHGVTRPPPSLFRPRAAPTPSSSWNQAAAAPAPAIKVSIENATSTILHMHNKQDASRSGGGWMRRGGGGGRNSHPFVPPTTTTTTTTRGCGGSAAARMAAPTRKTMRRQQQLQPQKPFSPPQDKPGMKTSSASEATTKNNIRSSIEGRASISSTAHTVSLEDDENHSNREEESSKGDNDGTKEVPTDDVANDDMDDWVVDAYDEAEFRVVDGVGLVEVTVPVPSVDDEEDEYYEMHRRPHPRAAARQRRFRGAAARRRSCLRAPQGPHPMAMAGMAVAMGGGMGSPPMMMNDFDDAQGWRQQQHSPQQQHQNNNGGSNNNGNGPRKNALAHHARKWIRRRREAAREARRVRLHSRELEIQEVVDPLSVDVEGGAPSPTAYDVAADPQEGAAAAAESESDGCNNSDAVDAAATITTKTPPSSPERKSKASAAKTKNRRRRRGRVVGRRHSKKVHHGNEEAPAPSPPPPAPQLPAAPVAQCLYRTVSPFFPPGPPQVAVARLIEQGYDYAGRYLVAPLVAARVLPPPAAVDAVPEEGDGTTAATSSMAASSSSTTAEDAVVAMGMTSIPGVVANQSFCVGAYYAALAEKMAKNDVKSSSSSLSSASSLSTSKLPSPAVAASGGEQKEEVESVSSRNRSGATDHASVDKTASLPQEDVEVTQSPSPLVAEPSRDVEQRQQGSSSSFKEESSENEELRERVLTEPFLSPQPSVDALLEEISSVLYGGDDDEDEGEIANGASTTDNNAAVVPIDVAAETTESVVGTNYDFDDARVSVKRRVEDFEKRWIAPQRRSPSADGATIVAATPTKDDEVQVEVHKCKEGEMKNKKEEMPVDRDEATLSVAQPRSVPPPHAFPPPIAPSSSSDGNALADVPIKVIFVGDPDVDASSIARCLTEDYCLRGSGGGNGSGCTATSLDGRRSSGVSVRNWDPFREEANGGQDRVERTPTSRTFSVWDYSGTPGGINHHSTATMFFSPNSLYVLVWDMGLEESKTWANPVAPDHQGHTDEFLMESSRRKADRALERNIDDKVLFYINQIGDAHSRGSAILPVALHGNDFESRGSEVEVKRRCDALKRRVQMHYDTAMRTPAKPLPKLLLGDDGSIPVVHQANGSGMDTLREFIVNAPPPYGFESSTSSHLLTDMQDVLDELRQEYKVVHVDYVISSLKESVGNKCAITKASVFGALELLSSAGRIMFFGGIEKQLQESEMLKNHEDILSTFVILSPQWFNSAVSCVLRPDLNQEIIETRSFMTAQGFQYDDIQVAEEMFCSFFNSHSNCPIITSDDVSLLWQSMEFMRDASDKSGPGLFKYLKSVLANCRVFVPVDLQGIPSAVNVGKESTFYLLPSLVASRVPPDVWSYKSVESWSATLCHSWLFRQPVPGLMEDITASVIQDVLNFSIECSEQQYNHCADKLNARHGSKSLKSDFVEGADNIVGHARIHQVMVFRDAFILKLGISAYDLSGNYSESIVEIFSALVGNDDAMCVASGYTQNSMKRLVVSARGQSGSGGRKIWNGGYDIVLKCVEKRLSGLFSEREVVCTECLSVNKPSMASTWKFDFVQAFVARGHAKIRCGCGHMNETDLLCGLSRKRCRSHPFVHQPPIKAANSLLGGVVLVGLFDAKAKQIRNVGSGFIADSGRGLIVTASHILFSMNTGRTFGRKFFGLGSCKVVIGVIPQKPNGTPDSTAVFRYCAEIVAHDVAHVDACVLRITTKFEQDVKGYGEGCGDQPETPLLNDIKAMRAEKLQHLKVTKKYELEESVRILGYNQSGEGHTAPGNHVNRSADFAKGYVCKKFKMVEPREVSAEVGAVATCFKPTEEVVVMCPTINGHSGGPCVNQEGAVIGILSRADPVEKHRCYLVPSCVLKRLLKKAKAQLALSPLDMHIY